STGSGAGRIWKYMVRPVATIANTTAPRISGHTGLDGLPAGRGGVSDAFGWSEGIIVQAPSHE
ncbi:MAG: hypothetical protein NZ561_01980, partial [Phycisphaerae bacterium]|nr:hypothetical protein [Phycisphaerae bacterium]